VDERDKEIEKLRKQNERMYAALVNCRVYGNNIARAIKEGAGKEPALYFVDGMLRNIRWAIGDG